MKNNLTQAEVELETAVNEARAAKFTPEQQKIAAVRSFFEILGLHNRGRMGDCALRTAHENAKKAIGA